MGLFLVLEGIDGAGKTTQARLLTRRLAADGRACLLTREPGGTDLGEELRDLLLDPRRAICLPAEVLLFMAARAQHVQEVIRPALAAGKTVICDRFTYSTLAYQGYGSGLNLDLLRAADGLATGGLRPDLTFILDLSADVQRQRTAGRVEDRMEGRDAEFRERVRNGFRELAQTDGCLVLDAAGDVEQIAKRIWEMFQQHLGDRQA